MSMLSPSAVANDTLIEYCVGEAAGKEAEAAERETASHGPLSLDSVKLVVAKMVDGLVGADAGRRVEN